MPPKKLLFRITVQEGEVMHTINVVDVDFLNAAQTVDREFVHADPKNWRGEIVRAERVDYVHILN
jgi:hypothetical protein